MSALFIDDVDLWNFSHIILGGEDRFDADIFEYANMIAGQGVELLVRHELFFKIETFLLSGFAEVKDDRFSGLPGVVQDTGVGAKPRGFPYLDAGYFRRGRGRGVVE